jgi:hypothetical protein
MPRWRDPAGSATGRSSFDLAGGALMHHHKRSTYLDSSSAPNLQ